MKIKRIIDQYRRDFNAIYECEYCGNEKTGGGYDDQYFHETVIPAMTYDKCRKGRSEDYRPLKTKYKDSEVV